MHFIGDECRPSNVYGDELRLKFIKMPMQLTYQHDVLVPFSLMCVERKCRTAIECVGDWASTYSTELSRTIWNETRMLDWSSMRLQGV